MHSLNNVNELFIPEQPWPMWLKIMLGAGIVLIVIAVTCVVIALGSSEPATTPFVIGVITLGVGVILCIAAAMTGNQSTLDRVAEAIEQTNRYTDIRCYTPRGIDYRCEVARVEDGHYLTLDLTEFKKDTYRIDVLPR